MSARIHLTAGALALAFAWPLPGVAAGADGTPSERVAPKLHRNPFERPVLVTGWP